MHRNQHALTAMMITFVACLQACAPANPRPESQAVRDYIAVAELGEIDMIRTSMIGRADYTVINEEFMIFESSNEYYLIEFRNRCYALFDDTRIPVDVRRDGNLIRAKFDTIRGCVIDKIYPVDVAQADELEQLGDASLDGGNDNN